jgi:hypothetical protein
MRPIVSAVAIVVLLGTAVFAHHSHPDFLTDQDATVEGTIEGIDFKNPHVVMTLRAEDSTVYTIEWKGAYYLRDNVRMVSPVEGSVESDTLKPGDRIVVVGCPPRDSSRHELVSLKRVERPLDGWLWTCRRSDKRMTC